MSNSFQCRLCLNYTDFCYCLYEEEIVDIIEHYARIKIILEDDGLPSTCCTKCLKDVHLVHEICSRIRHSDKYLRSTTKKHATASEKQQNNVEKEPDLDEVVNNQSISKEVNTAPDGKLKNDSEQIKIENVAEVGETSITPDIVSIEVKTLDPEECDSFGYTTESPTQENNVSDIGCLISANAIQKQLDCLITNIEEDITVNPDITGNFNEGYVENPSSQPSSHIGNNENADGTITINPEINIELKKKLAIKKNLSLVSGRSTSTLSAGEKSCSNEDTLLDGTEDTITINPEINIELKKRLATKQTLGFVPQQSTSTSFYSGMLIEQITKYHCFECSRDCNTRQSYLKHLSTHNTTTCSICNIKYPNHLSYLRHMDKHQSGTQICHICGSVAKNIQSLRGHMFHMHKNSKDQYTCEKCNQQFRYKYKYNLHIRKYHIGLRSHYCETCGKGFFTFTDLKHHSNMTHKKMRPHVCEYCGKAFSSAYGKKTHLRQHTNEKPFKCDVCADGFRQKVSLRSHMKSRHGITVAPAKKLKVPDYVEEPDNSVVENL